VSELERIKRKLSEYQPKEVTAPDHRVPAAVLVPFFEKAGQLHLLFTKRTSDLRHHQGEICFPGGTREPADEDLRFTALRELNEELSIEPQDVEILGALDTIKTYSSFYLVAPYVGFLRNVLKIVPNAMEVQEVLQIPFHDLLDPSVFREEVRAVDGREIPIYYYQWKSHTIWGLTGRILKTLLDL